MESSHEQFEAKEIPQAVRLRHPARVTGWLLTASAAILLAACGGSSSSSGNGDDDDTAAEEDDDTGVTLSEERARALAGATTGQVTQAIDSARLASEAGRDFDSDDLDDLDPGQLPIGGQGAQCQSAGVQPLVDVQRITQEAFDEVCQSGSHHITQVSENGLVGEAFVMNNCQNSLDEEGIFFAIEMDGSLQFLSDQVGNIDLSSDDFSVEVDFEMEEMDFGEETVPGIGPIGANFSSDGGYSGAVDDNGFSMTGDWDLGLGLTCQDEGFDFGLSLNDFSVESQQVGTAEWTYELNGTVEIDVAADVWDEDVREEVTYNTIEPLRQKEETNPATGQLETEVYQGMLEIGVGGQSVTMNFVEGGVYFGEDEFVANEDLDDLQQDELGPDLEGAVFEQCAGDLDLEAFQP